MTDLVFEPTTAPDHTRAVIANPFVEAAKQLRPDTKDALQVKLTDATRTDLNRVHRQLNDAGTELGVTVRRLMLDEDGEVVTADDIKALGDGTMTVTVKFYTVAKIKRGKKEADADTTAAPAE